MLTRTCARCGGEFALPADVYVNDWSNPRTTHCEPCRISNANAFIKALGQN